MPTTTVSTSKSAKPKATVTTHSEEGTSKATQNKEPRVVRQKVSQNDTASGQSISDPAKPPPKPKKTTLKEEVAWLQKNTEVVSGKRARPKMVYTPEDIEAMRQEENQSEYEYSSACESSETDSDD